LYSVGAENIINYIGKNNSYFLSFIFGALGGSSFFVSFAFYASIFILVRGGLDPLLLGIIGGIGLSIGDSLFYFLGFQGRKMTYGKFEYKISKFSDWLVSKPKWVVFIISFFYISITPFPNDILMISTGLAKYPYRFVALALFLGNTAFLIFLGFLASYGIKII
jgi:membrane protein YqaA with SNARE-associated domain